MRHYEVMFLVHPDQTGQVGGMVERYRSMVQSSGGTMHRLENLGVRPLAYPISKVHKAHYVLMNIETTSETVGEIKSSFQFNDAVVRNMIIRCDDAVTGPSPLMRSAREEEQRAAEARARAAAPAQSTAATPAQSDTTPAQSTAATPAQSDTTPAQAAAGTPAQSDTTPAQSATETPSATAANADTTTATTATPAPATESAEEPPKGAN
ncbi:MAG: 30S ribosomal protein S6 [Gammaproteobacteria bacterium]|nr:30S ribosomal protein S6 [Gammaproteobacteria bacterium]